jgi:hypothetical protein
MATSSLTKTAGSPLDRPPCAAPLPNSAQLALIGGKRFVLQLVVAAPGEIGARFYRTPLPRFETTRAELAAAFRDNSTAGKGMKSVVPAS